MVQHREEILASDFIIDCSHNALPTEEMFWYHREHTKKLIQIPNGVHGHIPRCPKYHIVVGSQKWKELIIYGRTQFYDNPTLSSIWGFQFSPVPERAVVGVFPWGTDTDFYSPAGEREDFWLFLSRPTVNKGLKETLWLAAQKKLTMKVVVGIGHPSHEEEIREQMPLVDEANRQGAKVDVITIAQGRQHHALKREFYRRAKGLIAYYTSHEPFGLVLIEALSCGLPIIGSNKGAMPEIIRHGETGFVCPAKEDMLSAVDRIEEINPEDCREDAVRRFDAKVWAQNLLNLLPTLEVARWPM